MTHKSIAGTANITKRVARPIRKQRIAVELVANSQAKPVFEKAGAPAKI